MPFPIRRVQTQLEKVIDYQYIRNIKNKEVRKNRFKRTLSQRVFRVLLILALIAELAYLGFQAMRISEGSRLFNVTKVEVTGAHKTNPEDIKKLVLSQQSNLLKMDLTKVKLTLENHPWIYSAVIWRELPATIKVHITERKPVALVLSGNLYLVDRAGRVIDTFSQDSEYSVLPILTGISDISNESQIRVGIDYIEALSVDPNILKQVSEIHPYDDDSTIVYIKGMTFGLLVSKDGILPMVKKFIKHSGFVKKNFQDVKLIDLRYQNQIILKDSYKEQL